LIQASAPNLAPIAATQAEDSSTTVTPVQSVTEPPVNEESLIAERVALEIETVDLQSLVDAVPMVGTRGGMEDDQSLGSVDRLIDLRNDVEDVDTVDLASLIGVTDSSVQRGFDDLASVLERQEAEREERASFAQTLVGGSIGITSGLSVGYLIWLVRGGTLMGSMLSSLPAWRFVDPLPVLGTLVDDVEGDEESLQSMVDVPKGRSG